MLVLAVLVCVIVSVREHMDGGDYPVRPRGNPLPQGVLLSIIFNSRSLEADEIRDKKQRRNGVQMDHKSSVRPQKECGEG